MQMSKEAIMLAVGLFLTAGLILIGLFAYNMGADAAKTATQDASSALTEMNENKYAMYENMEIKGSQVVNSVKRLKEDGVAGKIGIKIVTGENSTGTWYYNSFNSSKLSPSNADVAKIYDTSGGNNQYVNPNGTFKGTIERDANNTIRAIIFTQK